ncbi:16S rRNA (cytosine(967)-C(5))-methyltransferase RsmB [Paenibacillus radicis (ex Gao et al. 2016)]|uniref:16S rRNA (cytosine(967)-C(5))-methyltransferase n=1 Tax=Paenibacillus radicis (ex Gao et al. 2016) TaxID=1737354 RepID=A0A917HLX6_9BACL|nr:16S rRNA (cytosine(967)-C(5))-methyltransferase RsmB [Paenibacillus radicis (ex Gao et al. 2016)]GGG82686.1 ribosomal RNA small subunit methyltransferase B [Paenibacillus radicis (ex Gao et al. 2016)]
MSSGEQMNGNKGGGANAARSAGGKGRSSSGRHAGAGQGRGGQSRGKGQGRNNGQGNGNAPRETAGTRAPVLRAGRAPRTPRELALDTLVKVAETGAYSNLQLNRALQDAQLQRADAALATELVYGTIQRQLTLDHWLSKFAAKGLHKLEPWVHQLLRMSAYQLLYLDRIPAHAAVNEAVTIAKRRGHQGISGMVNGILRSIDRNRAELTVSAINDKDPVARIALRHSYPEWLVQRWIEAYGEEAAEAICAAGNEPPHASLRINPLRGAREEALRQLTEQGFDASASVIAPAGIAVRRGGNLADTEGFRQGKWTVQDESSMLVAEVAAPQPGMQVLDCCAAPGGKSTHLAELMEGKGKVWANDLHPHKRPLIEAQAERLGLNNIEVITGDAGALDERFPESSMEVVLLDAPCSGFGVIRRKPEIKWTKTAGDVAEIAAIQRRLLRAAANLVKPGGTLVYSTCTIEKAENEQQVAAFLSEHSEFELDAEWPEAVLRPLRQAGAIDESFAGQAQLLPQHFDSDGFFIARMRKRA